MDTINYIDTSGRPHGDLAEELQAAHAARRLRTFDSLPLDAVEIIDRAVIETAPLQMVGIPDLQTGVDETLVRRIDGLSAVTYTAQNAVSTGDAGIAMTPMVTKDHVGMRFASSSYPLPVIYENYQINEREMRQSRRVGFDKLASLASAATRAVTERAEDLLFNGALTIEGETIYGYTQYPDRQPYTITAPWTTATGEEIVADCNAMLQRVIDARHYGPCVLYIPPTYSEALRKDYITSIVSDTVLARIYALNTVAPGPGTRLRPIQMANIVAVRVAPYLADNNVVLVEMRSNTVNLIEGMALQNVELPPSSERMWEMRYAVVAMWVPALMAQEDVDGTKLCGIVHGVYTPPAAKTASAPKGEAAKEVSK